MSDKYSTSHMKKLVNTLESSHNSFQGRKNITSHMGSLKSTFFELDGMMKGQLAYIKDLNLRSSPQSQNPAQRPSEHKRILSKIIDTVYEEMAECIEVCKDAFILATKEKKMDNGWQKVLSELNKKFQQLKTTITPSNTFEVIFKLLNTRDGLLKQFLQSIIYQKNLLWMDLKIPYESYVHHEVQSILNIIKISGEKHGYVPTMIEFVPPSLNEEGRWSPANEKISSSVATYLKLALEDVAEMVSTIKNYSSLNDTTEEFEDINKNQVVVKGLREKIELLSNNYSLLMEKYRSVQANFKKESDSELKIKIEELEAENTKKESDISLLQGSLASSESSIVALKEKLKDCEEELGKLNNSYLPKVKEVEVVQKSLQEEFLKIKKDIEVASGTIDTDNELKARLREEIKAQADTINGLVSILGRERRKIKELKEDIKRLDMLVFELTNNNFSS